MFYLGTMECKFTVIFSNDRRGRLFLFSFQKGAVIRGKAIIQGRRLFQMMLTKSCALIIFFYYPILLYRHEFFSGKYNTREIHKNYIRDPSGLFSIISHVSLSMT